MIQIAVMMKMKNKFQINYKNCLENINKVTKKPNSCSSIHRNAVAVILWTSLKCSKYKGKKVLPLQRLNSSAICVLTYTWSICSVPYVTLCSKQVYLNVVHDILG